jgi:hypothetical protein
LTLTGRFAQCIRQGNGVVHAVLSIGALVAFTALSGGTSTAINNVTSVLP